MFAVMEYVLLDLLDILSTTELLVFIPGLHIGRNEQIEREAFKV